MNPGAGADSLRHDRRRAESEPGAALRGISQRCFCSRGSSL